MITIGIIKYIISKNIMFSIFILLNQYIEGIINLYMNIIIYVYKLSFMNEKENNFNYQSKQKDKKIKQYVKIHKWSNIELDNDLKYILYKPLRWRPTIVNKKLFIDDINKIKNELIKRFSKIIKNQKISIFTKTKYINSFNKFKQNLVNKLNKYIKQIMNKTIRNVNINYKQINIIRKFKKKYKNIDIIDSDKNYGNVIMYDQFWDNFNMNYLNENNDNFDVINSNNDVNDEINTIISKSKKYIMYIINTFKDYIIDYKNVINKIFSNKFDKIGKWASIPKVHKYDENGNNIKKLRPIINLKDSIISVSCSIVREISRKLIFRLKTMYECFIDCDDIRDIINQILQFNDKNELNVNDTLFACDINSMYDVITPNMVKEAFNYAIYELIPDYLSQNLINMWYKAMDHIFKFCYFKYKNVLYLLKNTQIQGSKSGGDNCNLYLIIHEIRNMNKIKNLTKIMLRYKDDIFGISKDKINNNDQCKNKIINKIYPQFEFEYNVNNKVEICDIMINIDYEKLKLSTTTLDNDNKITSFINKSSNINQSSINGIFKTLQMRYIIIDDNIIKYKNTKKRICNILINHNEWTAVDIRFCEHLSYTNRNKFIKNYIKLKNVKYNEYIKTKQVTLFNNKWWKDKYDKNENINLYITYQKTLIDEKQINKILLDSYKLLDQNLKNNYQIKLYYNYQQSIKNLLR